MTKRNLIAIFTSAIIIFLILALIVAGSINPTTQDNAKPNNQDTEMNTEPVSLDSDSQIENDIQTAPGTYTEYSIDKLTDGTNVIFFAAGWCPSCAELDRNLSTTQIPDMYTILKTDYDNSQELRVKYGVTSQHTLVQVDKSGNLIKKVNGLYSVFTIEDIIQEFN